MQYTTIMNNTLISYISKTSELDTKRNDKMDGGTTGKYFVQQESNGFMPSETKYWTS